MTDRPTIEAAPMCFACGQDNPIGLRINYELQCEECKGRFTPGANHVGFSNGFELSSPAFDSYTGSPSGPVAPLRARIFFEARPM